MDPQTAPRTDPRQEQRQDSRREARALLRAHLAALTARRAPHPRRHCAVCHRILRLTLLAPEVALPYEPQQGQEPHV